MTTSSEFKRNWRVVVAGAVGVGSGVSLFGFVYSLFIQGWEREFNWSRAEISLAYFAAPAAALFMPLIGAMVDRFGARIVATVSTVLLCVVYGFIVNISDNVWLLYASLFAAAFLGGGSGPISYSRAVASRFDAARGLALALTLSGTAVMAIIFPPILNWVIDTWGWRWGIGLLVLIAAGFGLPAAFFGLRERADPATGLAEAPAVSPAFGFTVLEALRGAKFWILCLCVFLIAAPIFGVTAHMKPLFLERGFSSGQAALMISALASAVLCGRLLTGYLIDRYWAPGIAAALVVSSAVGALMIFAAGGSFWLAALGVFLLGAAQGAELDIMAYLTSRYFGLRAFSTLYGALAIAYSLAFPTGALIYANVRAETGQYDGALIIASASLAAAAVLLLTLGRYPRPPQLA
ncbi:MAG: MFS transporter [Hyphomonadaceae bacterium]|nr:MFS transporter [Hyphomonadaceae bacterium]